MLEGLFGSSARSTMVSRERALAGRDASAYPVPGTHAVLGTSLQGPWPEGTRVIYLALGCFWGAEKLFWELPGVVTTAAGYQGGYTRFPTYEETCTSLTGHTETVLVAYDPSVVSDEDVLRAFWENHDPTQGYRQGNDVGTQYRSAVYWTTPEQEEVVRRTHALFQERLRERGYSDITTELRPADEAGPFYYAEEHHQQYLHKVPNGYCPVHATGVRCG
ncbi:peptide-methionine (S)-S-oxide reductase [Flavimobilis soli]|uniref:Peptide methionine sulfoxide reductase MsrA n=1 Tax=Flavimobilis soli TaxID=442709 RepID=A0A2A9EF42_9MICO|nr:peptide-methionine (S)-S-oxide reductase MsrA [Flavimobilis soli]PFG37534.1 peptide-methionine (S)-S-oxide reductase [Flavimobilis soli]